jgi:hypothetical protein
LLERSVCPGRRAGTMNVPKPASTRWPRSEMKMRQASGPFCPTALTIVVNRSATIRRRLRPVPAWVRH